MVWIKRHPQATIDMLGLIPSMLDESDPMPAKKQIDANYQHGGGWRPFRGFTMTPAGNILFPGDPVRHLLWETKFRNETIRFYESEWLAIIQPDGTFEISRID